MHVYWLLIFIFNLPAKYMLIYSVTGRCDYTFPGPHLSSTTPSFRFFLIFLILLILHTHSSIRPLQNLMLLMTNKKKRNSFFPFYFYNDFISCTCSRAHVRSSHRKLSHTLTTCRSSPKIKRTQNRQTRMQEMHKSTARTREYWWRSGSTWYWVRENTRRIIGRRIQSWNVTSIGLLSSSNTNFIWRLCAFSHLIRARNTLQFKLMDAFDFMLRMSTPMRVRMTCNCVRQPKHTQANCRRKKTCSNG